MNELTHKQIAEVLEISVQEVRKIEKTALRKIKAPNKKNRILKDYLFLR